MRFFALVYPAWCQQPDVLGNEPSFDDPRAAWAWLKLARWQEEEKYPGWTIGEVTDTVGYLDYAATECEFGNPHEDWPLSPDGTGAIIGATPGLGDHAWDDEVTDPGIAYAVVAR